MGRPPTKPKRFKDGFYIEVRNKGAGVGMKIHFETLREMEAAAAMYGNGKEVIILGEHRKDRWLNEAPENKPAARVPKVKPEAKAAPVATKDKPAKKATSKPESKKVVNKKAAKPEAKAKKTAKKK